MSAVLIADVFVIAGLLGTMCFVGLMRSDRAGGEPRLSAILMLSVALAVIAASRRWGASGEGDVLAWALAGLTLPQLCQPPRLSSAQSFTVLAITLGIVAVSLTLMGNAR